MWLWALTIKVVIFSEKNSYQDTCLEVMFDNMCSTATRDCKIAKIALDFESKVELRNMLGSSMFSFANK